MTGRLATIAVLAAAGCAAIIEQNRRNEDDIKACDAGNDAQACLRVGRLWRGAAENPNRPGADVSYERQYALVAYDRACGAGLVLACAEGTELFSAASSVYEGNHPELRQRMEGRACDLGDDALCFAIANRMADTDPSRVALARMICNRTVERCVETARLVWGDHAIALELASRPCTLRAAQGCSEAASMEFGETDRDALLLASCELRTAKDCFALANRESESPGGAARALEHYRMACKLDHAEACVKVGQLRATPP